MIKILLALVAILSFPKSSFSQESQMEYYPIGTFWEEVHAFPNGTNTFRNYRNRSRFTVDRDTIVDGKRYKIVQENKVESSYPLSPSSFFLREQGDSVFYCRTIGQESLAYAFNWQSSNDTIRWFNDDFNRKDLILSHMVLEDGNTYDCFTNGFYTRANQLIWSIGKTERGLFSNTSSRSGTLFLTKFCRNGVLIYENEVFSFIPVDKSRHTVTNVEYPGVLDSILTQYSFTDADSLTVNGLLNGSDIRTLRNMLGGKYPGSTDTDAGSLRYLDLTAARIRTGGEDYLCVEDTGDTGQTLLFTAQDAIGDYMFSECPMMEEVRLPYGVNSIGNGAFMGSQSLRRVIIPEKVRTIGSFVFQNCTSLESVSLPYTITSAGDGLVEGCTSLRSVACAATEPPTCTENTFGDMAGVTLYVPIGCAGKYRMSTGWNRFADIVEPDPMTINVSEAGTLESAINELGLDNSGQMKVTGELNGNDIRTLRRMLGGTYNTALEEPSRGKLSFLDLSDAAIVSGGQDYFFIDILKNSYLPSANTANDVFGQYMFFRCENLEQCMLPQGIKSIEDYAFLSDNHLKEITIPEGVEDIGSGAFIGCFALKHLFLPSTLHSLGDMVGAEKVESVTCMATVPPTCTEATFIRTDTSALLYVPAGSVERYRNSVGWREFFDIREYDPLGISELAEPLQEKREGIYDLQGRKLSSIPAKGIYIQNGKKYVR